LQACCRRQEDVGDLAGAVAKDLWYRCHYLSCLQEGQDEKDRGLVAKTMQRSSGAMPMSIVNYIKIVFTSPCEKNVHFRHALSLSKNTLWHTCKPPLWQLLAPLAVLNDLRQVKSRYMPPKKQPTR